MKYILGVCNFHLILSMASSCYGSQDECFTEYTGIALPLLSSAWKRQQLRFLFNGQSMSLSLSPQPNIFTEQTKVSFIDHDDIQVIDFKQFATMHGIPRTLYTGTVQGQSTSFVYGTVSELGVFDGYFIWENVTYYLEPYSRYFPNSHPNAPYNALSYRSVDVYPCGRTNDCAKNGKRVPRHSTLAAKATLTALPVLRSDSRAQVCELTLVGDFRFYNHVYMRNTDDVVSKLWLGLWDAQRSFRSVDISGDGNGDYIGYRFNEFKIYKHPMRSDLTEIDRWDPVNFFKELSLYDFRNICGALLLTYRLMDPASEVNAPSLFKSSIVSYEQGICSKLEPRIPDGIRSDYGEYITNALPINYYFHGQPITSERHIMTQAAHQFAHLLGAMDDEDYRDEECSQMASGQKYLGTFPIMSPPSGDRVRMSFCGTNSIKAFLTLNNRPCLRACDPNYSDSVYIDGTDRRGKFVPTPNTTTIKTTTTTTTTTTRSTTTNTDWTEVCFTSLIASASPLETLGIRIAFLVSLSLNIW